MLELIKQNHDIKFMEKRWIAYTVSIVMFVLSLCWIGIKGMNYGIDFAGGAEIAVKISSEVSATDLRNILAQEKIDVGAIQTVGDARDREYIIKLMAHEGVEQLGTKVTQVLTEKIGKDKIEIRKADVVGPRAGKDLKENAILSLLIAFLGILIYVGIRFDMNYAPSLVVAVVHDIIFTAGMISFLGVEFDLQIVAALLLIAGYSNNDTIIIYDRIREVRENNPQLSLWDAINKACNETLSRTIMTTLATLMVVVSMLVLGGAVLKGFAITLLVGMMAGTYSSIFVASPLMHAQTEYLRKKAEAKAAFKPADAK